MMKTYTAKFVTIALASLLVAPQAAPAAQPQTPPSPQAAAPDKTTKQGQDKVRPRSVQQQSAPQSGERLEGDDRSGSARADVPAETLAGRHENIREQEQQEVLYFNNFMSTYRLGPEDVISIRVFGLERYSVANIVVPPDGIISHPLIPEGVFVVGKTREQVQEEIKKKLDEYVIDPKVTVSLDKAQSAVFWVMGDVAQPGIRPMTRRLSVYEAVAMSGGVLRTGNKSKVTVMRRQRDGTILPTVINVSAIEKGKQPDNFFLQPGDQVVVPGNKYKTFQEIMQIVNVVSVFRIFTGF